MGILLILQIIVISLIIGLYSYSFWFRYILFIVIIGGLIILFIYITRLASNLKLSINFKPLVFIPPFIISFIIFYYLSNKNIFIIKNQETEQINNFLLDHFNLNKLFNFPNLKITLILIIYLLLTLIVIVKIIKSNQRTIRQT